MLATCLALAFSSRTAALRQPMVRARAEPPEGPARRSPLRCAPQSAALATRPGRRGRYRCRRRRRGARDQGAKARTPTTLRTFALPAATPTTRRPPPSSVLTVPTIGVDEVGRGCLAGPVVACACYLPAGVDVEGIADSKTITTEKAREAIYEQLREAPGALRAGQGRRAFDR